MSLPEPRRADRYAIEVVCSGNICRSPSADVVLSAKAAAAGLDDVVVTSSGIGDWHAGQPMDHRSAAVLARAGYDPARHRARQVERAALASYDLVLAMDRTHLADLLAMGAEPVRTRLFRDFDPVGRGEDVPDPYYGGPDGFEEVLSMVERTSDAIVEALARRTTRAATGRRTR